MFRIAILAAVLSCVIGVSTASAEPPPREPQEPPVVSDWPESELRAGPGETKSMRRTASDGTVEIITLHNEVQVDKDPPGKAKTDGVVELAATSYPTQQCWIEWYSTGTPFTMWRMTLRTWFTYDNLGTLWGISKNLSTYNLHPFYWSNKASWWDYSQPYWEARIDGQADLSNAPFKWPAIWTKTYNLVIWAYWDGACTGVGWHS